MMLRHLAASLALAALPSVAHASPWTLRQGEVAVVAGFDYQWATDEFLDDYRAQSFPLRGRYSASSFTLGARAGFTDRLELELVVPLKLVSYRSDPVILLEGEGLDFYQENIIDLSRSRQGVGDIWITGRYNLVRWPVAIAIEGRLKTPTGYDGPEGTFGDRPRSNEEFLANVGTFVTPDNVRDDVVLGDGQVDLQLNLLLGTSFPSRTFLRLDAGYALRLGGAGDQVIGSFKIGQAIGERVLVFADTRFAYTVTEGDVIGVSVAAIDPDVRAEDYGGTDNLLLREVRLERDAITVGLGGILRITDAVEMNVAYQRTVWGRNTSQVDAIFLGFGVRTNLLSNDEPATEAEPEQAPTRDDEDEARDEDSEATAESEGAYDEPNDEADSEPTYREPNREANSATYEERSSANAREAPVGTAGASAASERAPDESPPPALETAPSAAE